MRGFFSTGRTVNGMLDLHQLKRIAFRVETSGRVKDLRGFTKGHSVPDYDAAVADKFVARIAVRISKPTSTARTRPSARVSTSNEKMWKLPSPTARVSFTRRNSIIPSASVWIERIPLGCCGGERSAR